ncbi:MAG: hypothetical protein M3032_05830 [Verrucomicrobiota bacterium]|nr:hypothetical protein [Verrucomicrobiota bacterium]
MNDCNGNVRALEQRDLLIKCGRRLGYVVVVVAVSFGALRGYQSWRKQNLAKQTSQFAAQGDFQSAVLVARRLLQLDENNLVAARAMAQVAEKAGSADAVTWRKKIVQLEPQPANELALAKCALRFGQIDLADHVVDAFPQTARQTVAYHEIAGAVSLAQKNMAAAEEHFAAAVEFAPSDSHLVLNLALVRLGSPEPRRVEQARASLNILSKQPVHRLASLRALAADALAHGDRANARQWATALQTEADTTFADALVYFQTVEGTDATQAALRDLQATASTSASSAAELITFLNRHDLAQAAVDWSATLPKPIVETQPVPLAIAESFSFLQNWNSLQKWVEGKNWGAYESMRLAVESHALRRLSPADRSSMQSETAWRAAVKAAQSHPEQLAGIAQLAEGWGYTDNAAAAWWALANETDHSRTALYALQRIYKAQRDTRGLLRVATRALELNPNDLVAANNCASLGLLLSSDNTARRLALKLHAEHPANRAFAATYAFALHSEGKNAEALKVIETLKDEELRHPAIAAYYVVMLVEGKKLNRARAFLNDAKRASLLPEEQKLLSAATRKLIGADGAVASAL